MKKSVVLALLLLCSPADAQLPDPSNAVIIAKLKAMISQGLIRNKTLKKIFKKSIDALKVSAETYKDLKEFQDEQRALLRDLRGIKELDLTNTDQLQRLIESGDSFEFYLGSTSRALFRNVDVVSNLSGNLNNLIGLFGENGQLLADNDKVQSVANDLNYESALTELAVRRQREKMIATYLEQAVELKALANDSAVELAKAERAKLLNSSTQLALKASELQNKVNEEVKSSNNEIVNHFLRQLMLKDMQAMADKAATRKRKYGYYDSPFKKSRPLK